jgi:alpha-galactosidase/6-phospho-beta-glucosidase family protein
MAIERIMADSDMKTSMGIYNQGAVHGFGIDVVMEQMARVYRHEMIGA